VSRLGDPYGECFDPSSKNSTRNVYEELYPVEYSETVSRSIGVSLVFETQTSSTDALGLLDSTVIDTLFYVISLICIDKILTIMVCRQRLEISS